MTPVTRSSDPASQASALAPMVELLEDELEAAGLSLPSAGSSGGEIELRETASGCYFMTNSLRSQRTMASSLVDIAGGLAALSETV